MSGQAHHRELASYFYNPYFFDPLLDGKDTLNGEHANAHLPVAVGVARGAELTSNATLRAVALKFWERLNSTYTFTTGGSSVNEYWHYPMQHGEAMATKFNESDGTPQPLDSNGFHTQEMCTNYNALKLIRHLLQWHGGAEFGDSYERRCSRSVRLRNSTAAAAVLILPQRRRSIGMRLAACLRGSSVDIAAAAALH
jgi:DUF1680 family protein